MEIVYEAFRRIELENEGFGVRKTRRESRGVEQKRRDEALTVLKEFLAMPLYSADNVFEKFSALKGAGLYRGNGEQEGFVYVPGGREDRVVLVAHADTVWYGQEGLWQTPVFDEEERVFYGENRSAGIGADDRAGCALLWLLRDSGHSLLICDGEECGSVGVHYLMREYPDIAAELNASRFMIQLDRRGNSDCKYYDLPVGDDFREYVKRKTGFDEPDRSSSTDIRCLCTEACGVNLSVGYYNEHCSSEVLALEDWLKILGILDGWLAEEIPSFRLTMCQS